ncbi:MAG: hypothetical protein K2X71_11720 [Methylobacterium sp.]|uniref:hypothetical protein n=1 Tax=Methylobacterium sp. TaxID=409 RepID=UPI00258CC7ED|nr:hypothetical protein [Methylobacterium sp.]MBY0296694.1 hypothetical protein [Methylobacterium sp.]
MTYDLVKQLYPGAPAQLGARVRERASGRLGRIIPPVPGTGEQVRVRFDDEILPRNVHPPALDFVDAEVVPLRRPHDP